MNSGVSDEIIFVYGTLMKGQPAHYLLHESEFFGKGVLSNFGLYRVAEYPGIIRKAGAYVHGELYRVEKRTLLKIDNYEEEGALYKREKVSVKTTEGKSVMAWTYVWLNTVRETDYIRSGKYC